MNKKYWPYHLIFSGYIIFIHPLLEKYIFGLNRLPQSAPIFATVMLVLVVAEHFSSRAKLIYLVQRFKKNYKHGETVSDGGSVALWLAHMLGLMIVSGWAMQSFFGGDIKAVPDWIFIAIAGPIVIKDILYIFVTPQDKEYEAKPCMSERTANTILLLFALCAHSMFWGVGVEGNDSILYHPYINSFAAVTFTAIMNVLGISLLFVMSYCASRVLFIVEESMQAKETGSARVLLAYAVVIASNVVSIMLSQSSTSF